MKLNSKLFAVALICVAALSSCTKPGNTAGNNDNSGSESTTPGKDDKVAKAQVEYKFLTSDDLLQYFDMKIIYWDPEKQTDMVIEKASKSALGGAFDSPLPGKMAIELQTTLKDGVTLEDIKANSVIGYILPSVYYRLVLYNAAGEFLTDGGWWAYTAPATNIISGEKVVERFNNGSFSKKYSQAFDENGEFIHEQ